MEKIRKDLTILLLGLFPLLSAAQDGWDRTKWPDAEPYSTDLAKDFTWKPGVSNQPLGTAREAGVPEEDILIYDVRRQIYAQLVRRIYWQNRVYTNFGGGEGTPYRVSVSSSTGTLRRPCATAGTSTPQTEPA